MNQAGADMNATELLTKISEFSKKVSLLTTDFETFKSAYIYVSSGDEDLEVEFYSCDDLQFIINNTNEDIVDYLLQKYEPNTTYSDSFLEEFTEAVESNFYIQYQRLMEERRVLTKQLQILELDENIFDNLLAGATEFYESSRCW